MLFFAPLEFYKNFMICHDLLLDKNKKSPERSGAGRIIMPDMPRPRSIHYVKAAIKSVRIFFLKNKITSLVL